MKNTKEVSEFLQKNVDWNLYFTMVNHVGDELNTPKLRFTKSDLFEQAIQNYSDKKILWKDAQGYDHIIPSSGTKLEMKFTKHSLYRKSGMLRTHTAGLRLTNTQGNHDGIIPDYQFHYLLISDLNAAALISIDDLKNSGLIVQLDEGSFGIKNNTIPTSNLEFICTPDEWVQEEGNRPTSFAASLEKMREKYLNAFK